MKCNVALWDRVLRFIFGVIFTAWAIAGGPGWAYFGVYLLATSAWGYCALYPLIGAQSLKEISSHPTHLPPKHNVD